MSEFTDRMEAEAEQLAKLMVSESRKCGTVPDWNSEVNCRRNIKPFYSPYANFDPQACRVVFIGDNPGGNPSAPDDTTGTRYRNFLNSNHGGYNAFLHETWPGYRCGGAPMQLAVQWVFGALFGNGGPEELLKSASFNVCPLRTSKTRHIPCAVWEASETWCNSALDCLKPELIICCGFSDDYLGAIGKSPWAAMKRRPNFKVKSRRDWKKGQVGLKYGEFTGGTLCGTSVIGMYHLSKSETVDSTVKLIETYRERMRIPRESLDVS